MGESNSGSMEPFQSPNGRRFRHGCIFLGLRLGLASPGVPLCRGWFGNTWEGLAEEPERRLDWEVRMPQNRCVGSGNTHASITVRLRAIIPSPGWYTQAPLVSSCPAHVRLRPTHPRALAQGYAPWIVGAWVGAHTLASVARPAEGSVHLSCLR